MLRIGDFSQLAQVSVPTLRHYDELGLIKPATVDKFTDYRYYTVEQLPRLNRILALKDLGLSLDQIKRLLDKDMPPSQLRSMLATKQAEIEQQIDGERARLQRVEARLQQIEGEGGPSRYEVVLKKVDALTIVGMRQRVPHVSQMADLRAPALQSLHDGLRSIGVSGAQDELVLYHNSEYHEDDIDMEVVVALDNATVKRIDKADLPSDMQVSELPAVATMASTIHHGVLWDVPYAIIALFTWIGTNGFRSAGSIRELHLFGSELDIPDDEAAREQIIVMEIQIPVERDVP